MVDPVMRHPAADGHTAEALVLEQDRRVVPLSGWIADAAVTAASSQRTLHILTPPRSRITYPLELLITDGHAQWVVRDGTERFRDGLTGEPLRWNGARFSTSERSGALPTPEQPSSIEVQVTALHRADSALQLGMSGEAVLHALTGGPPAGWSTSEPVSEPWSPRELTRHCHDRSPEPTRVVLVGGNDEFPAIGMLEVSATAHGVRERLRVAGPASAAVSQQAIEELVVTLAGKVRSLLVATQPGRIDGLRGQTPTFPALPYGVLFGHQVIGEHGGAHARATPATSVRMLGVGSKQSCWCLLGGGSLAPYEQLTEVLHHFGLSSTAS